MESPGTVKSIKTFPKCLFVIKSANETKSLNVLKARFAAKSETAISSVKILDINLSLPSNASMESGTAFK